MEAIMYALIIMIVSQFKVYRSVKLVHCFWERLTMGHPISMSMKGTEQYP